MLKKSLLMLTLVATTYLSGCASVPMAPKEEDQAKKEFNAPQENAGLYIYRNSNFGGALKKSVYIDNELIGETAPMTYFYKEITPGEHKLSTESEFSNNDITLQAEKGKNYFVLQIIKMGLMVGGAVLREVPEEKGKKGVLECKLAKQPEATAVSAK